MNIAVFFVIIALAIIGRVIMTVGTQGITRFTTGTTPTLSQNVRNALWLTAGWGFLILIMGLVIGDWWWAKVFSVVGISLIVGFTLYGYMTPSGPPFRHKLAMIGIWILVGVSVWQVFGKEWWKNKAGVDVVLSSPRVNKVVVIVPASGPSEIVPTPGQADIATEGPIWVYTSNGNRYPSYKGNRVPIPVRTSTLQFEVRPLEGQSETPAGPVKVTVSRW